MTLHRYPRSLEARQRRAERRHRARLRKLAAADGPASVEALAPTQAIDARFVAAAAERLDRDQLASTTQMFQRAVEDLVEMNFSNKPRGDGV